MALKTLRPPAPRSCGLLPDDFQRQDHAVGLYVPEVLSAFSMETLGASQYRPEVRKNNEYIAHFTF